MEKIKDQLQIFTIWNNEIEGRIDPYFYQSKFKNIYKLLNDGNYQIKNLSEIIDGNLIKGILPKHEERGNDINVVQISNIDMYGIIDTTSCLKAKKEIFEKKHNLNKNDILIVITGATIGKVGFWAEDIEDYCLGGDIVKFQVKENANPIYVWSYLLTQFGQKQILKHVTGATNKHLSPLDIEKIQIPLPPLLIQNKIVAIMSKAYKDKKRKEDKVKKLLDSIDSYVLGELGIKMPEIKKEMVFTVYSDKIKGRRIDPKAYLEKPKAILKAIQKSKYKSKKLSDIILGSIAGEWGKDPLFTDNTDDYILVNVLRNTNFDNKFNLNFENVAKRLITKDKFKKVKLQKNDILIEKSGGSPIQPVGRIAIIDDDNENFGFSNFLQCLKTDKKECLPHYLFSYLKTIYNLGYMEYVQNQTTGIKNLIMEEYLLIPISLPSLAVQNKIAKKVNSIYRKARVLRKEAKEVLKNAKEKVEEMILG